MGPIKINIKTDTSEYGGDCDQVPDVTQKDKEIENQESKSDQNLTSDETPQTDDVYDYEGEDCYYTEPSSGVRYKWSKETSAWINTVTGESRGSGDAATTGADIGVKQNYKMEDGTYVYVDRLTNKKHKWNLETKVWDEVENNEEPEEEDEESEEDENMSEADRRARQYRKRKAAPDWDQVNYQKVRRNV